MRVDVRFLDDAKTRAEITLTPSWLARLFGAPVRQANVFRQRNEWDNYPAWRWESTGDYVPTHVREAIQVPRLATRRAGVPEARVHRG